MCSVKSKIFDYHFDFIAQWQLNFIYMKSIISSLIFLCFYNSTWAASFVDVRSEESRWIVEVIQESTDGWPEIKERSTYPTQEMALDKKIQLEETLPDLTSDRMFVRPQMAQVNLWTPQNAWSYEWEQKYSEWIEKNVSKNFFLDYKIPTDCADVAYSLRWIFARINSLPMASKLGSLNTLMTNETVRPQWAVLPTDPVWHKDQRFMAALTYVTTMTYTHTLWDDSYPIKLDRKYFLSGVYHLSLDGGSGHTQVVKWLGSDNQSPFITLNSTVPRAVRSLSETIYSGYVPKPKQNAFLKFRWAVQTKNGVVLANAADMYDYSLEQFSFASDSNQYLTDLLKKLGYEGGEQSIIAFLARDLSEQFQIRKSIVDEGYEKCQVLDCQPGTEAWENYSTPSRDSRIKAKIEMLEALSGSNTSYGAGFDSQVVVQFEGLAWSSMAIVWNWKHKKFNSDPRVTPIERWGAGYNSWLNHQVSFIESLLSQRFEKLTSAKIICEKEACDFSSKNWDLLGSHEIDRKILNQINYMKNGRDLLPKEIQQLLSQNNNQELFSVEKESITINKLLTLGHQWSSSPNASLRDQWAIGKKVMLVALKSPSDKIYFKRWLINVSHQSVIDYTTNEKVHLPGQLILAFNGAPVLLIKSEGRYFTYELKTNHLQPIPQFDYVSLQESHTFNDKMVTFQDQVHVWQLDADLVKFEKVKSFSTPGQVINEDFIGVEGQIYDVAWDRFYEPGIAYNVMQVTNHFFTYKVNLKTYIVSRLSGERKFLFETDLFTLFDTDLDKRLIMFTMFGSNNGGQPGSRFLHFDDNFQISNDQIINEYCGLNFSIYVSCFSFGNSIYEIKNGKLELMNTDSTTLWVNENYTVKKVGSFNHLIERKTNQILMKAHQILPISAQLVAVKKADGEGFHLFNPQKSEPLVTHIMPGEFIGSYYYKGGLMLTDSEDYDQLIFVDSELD